MKLTHLLAAATFALVGLTACGGGGGGSNTSSSGSSSTVQTDVAALSFTDSVVGTGDAFATGMVATITYTGWLYSPTAAGNKGTQVDSGSFPFTVGGNQVITGLEQGMAGMKVGGKRTIVIPSSLAYGTAGSGPIPGGAALVFDVTLTSVAAPAPVASPAQLSFTDAVVGTGAAATTGKSATVTYTGWLYSDTAPDHKGTQFDASTFTFTIGGGQIISGFDQGVTGMLVGGKRTVLIPASLAYGTAGYGSIPPNSGLVFDVSLSAVQ